MYAKHLLRCNYLGGNENSAHLSRFSFTSIQIAHQPKLAAWECVAIPFLQALAIGWIDGGEVAAIHCRPSLCLRLDQGHQLWKSLH